MDVGPRRGLLTYQLIQRQALAAAPLRITPGDKNRYLGLQFVIKGQVHYGWARLTVTFSPQKPAAGVLPILTGYAYETEPNKPILTGKTKGPDVITLDPATLGYLAGGASQIPAWRGERKRK